MSEPEHEHDHDTEHEGKPATEPAEPGEGGGDGGEEEAAEETPAEARKRRKRERDAANEDPAEVQARKIETAKRNYRKDLAGIVGTLEGTADCPYCDGLALVPDELDFAKRDDVEECERCKGLGFMLTGSHVPEHRVLSCPTCSGTGYARPDQQPSYVQPAVPGGTVTPLPMPAPAPAQQVHGWFDPVSQTFHPYGEAAPS